MAQMSEWPQVVHILQAHDALAFYDSKLNGTDQ